MQLFSKSVQTKKNAESSFTKLRDNATRPADSVRTLDAELKRDFT